MSTDAQTLIGVIEGIEIKDGFRKDGTTPWRRHAFKIRTPAGTRTISTFDKGWPTNLVTGQTYRFTYTEKQGDTGMLRDLTGAMQVDPSEFGAQPATNGEFKQPYEPPTDEAKTRVATADPQPEFKSPSRSYDQNQDITRRSIERQIALKAAIETMRIWPVEDISSHPVLEMADDFFAWLREAPSDVRSSPAEPSSEAQGTDEPPSQAWRRSEDDHEEQPAESDGEPAFFPDDSSLQIKTMAQLETALKKLAKANRAGWTDKTWKAGVSAIIGEDVDQAGNLQVVFERVKHEFAEQESGP